MGNDYIRVSKDIGIWGPNAFSFHVAFVFDAVCWNLLVGHFAPGELNLDRLFEVCKMQPEWSYVVGLLALLHYRSMTTNGI